MSKVKTCGGCTVCCKFLSVPPLKKKPNTQCRFCNEGEGCTIYDERPPICQSFECLWKQDPDMAEKLKPNVSGVLFDRVQGSRIVAALFDPGTPFVLAKPEVQNFLAALVRNGYIVGVTRASFTKGVVWLKPDDVTQEELESELKVVRRKIGWQPRTIRQT